MKQNMKGSKIAIMIIVCSILALGCILSYFFMPSRGEKIQVTLDQKLYGVYDLRQDRTIKVELDHNEYNLIIIKDHQVCVKESTCKNQICVKTPPISKDSNEPIVCLPHKLIIETKA